MVEFAGNKVLATQWNDISKKAILQAIFGTI
jgi:hypothetical protein